MPTKRTELLTDWITVATSGPTCDGRKIEEFKIIEAAASYDPAEYCAVINADHIFGNFGTVREARTSKDNKGRTILQVRIAPNDYAIQQNKADYRLFFSIELTPNFCGSGKYYLTGLALTDNPASVGTTELHFTARKGSESYSCDEIEASALLGIPAQADVNFFVKIINALKDNFNITEKGKEMNPEQFKEMTALLKSNGEAMSKLTEAVESLKKEEKPQTAPAEPEKNPGSKQESVNFKAEVAEAVKPVIDAFNKLDSSIKELFKEQPGTPVPKSSAAATETAFV